MVLPGILGIMTGVGLATFAAIGLLFFLSQQNEQQHSYRPHARNSHSAKRYSEWNGYDATDTRNCSICLEEIDFPTCRVLSCKHAFHTACIDKWMITNKECPNCRKRV